MDLSKYEKIFAQESDKYFREMDELLITVEKNPANRDLWGEIHGKIHSVKGMAAALGYSAISGLSHSMETWCKRFQQGETPTARAIQSLFDGLDVLRRLAAAKGVIEDGGPFEKFRSVSASLSSPPEVADIVSNRVGPPAAGQSAFLAPIDQISVKYELIEELIGLSQEILSLEKNLQSEFKKQLPPIAGNWVVIIPRCSRYCITS
jgi:two-component system, chemotaxis family, sensor kinase CheA